MEPESKVCPECGASLAAGRSECWLCQHPTDAASQPNPYASPQPIVPPSSGQFSLATLMLVITLVAVSLGAFVLAPGLGILFAVIAGPAFLRTAFTALYYKQAGSQLTVSGKITAFLISFVIMIAVGFAAFIAFQIVCWSGALLAQGNEPWPNIFVGIVVGLIAGIPVLIWLLAITWPSREAIVLDSIYQGKH